MNEKTYTMAEAEAEWRRRECIAGHSFGVTAHTHQYGGVYAVNVGCEVCGWSGTVDMNGPDPSWVGLR